MRYKIRLSSRRILWFTKNCSNIMISQWRDNNPTRYFTGPKVYEHEPSYLEISTHGSHVMRPSLRLYMLPSVLLAVVYLEAISSWEKTSLRERPLVRFVISAISISIAIALISDHGLFLELCALGLPPTFCPTHIPQLQSTDSVSYFATSLGVHQTYLQIWRFAKVGRIGC